MNKVKLFFVFFGCLNILFSQEKSKLIFNDDFQSGDFNKEWMNKEITKNNGYKIDTISKEGRFNDNYLITYTKKPESMELLKDLNTVLNYTIPSTILSFFLLVSKYPRV